MTTTAHANCPAGRCFNPADAHNCPAIKNGDAAQFRDHTGFKGTVEASTRTDTDYLDCELVLDDGRRIGAKRYELEARDER